MLKCRAKISEKFVNISFSRDIRSSLFKFSWQSYMLRLGVFLCLLLNPPVFLCIHDKTISDGVKPVRITEEEVRIRITWRNTYRTLLFTIFQHCRFRYAVCSTLKTSKN